MSSYFYYQQEFGTRKWLPVPVSHRQHLETESRPALITALSVSKLVEDLPYEDKLKLAYAGPLYFDWDSKDESLVIDKVQQFLLKLEDLKVDLEMCHLYASGGKGYHLQIPQEVFMDRIPKGGVIGLPYIYHEIARELCVDTLDMTIYSGSHGRMWRTPNVLRDNGRYKVPITVAEMREMTPELCHALTAAPRNLPKPTAPEFAVQLSILYSRCAQKVEDLLKRRAKFKPDPLLREKASGASLQWAMAGLGIRPGTGFHELALQLAIAASAAGTAEDKFIEECQGLIASHQSDNDRYGSEKKRADELRRLFWYVNGNACYEFSVGAIKKLLTHSAPDLDGLKVTKEEVREVIEDAAAEELDAVDEYSDVAKGVTLAKHGIYMDTEYGKKRICAISFTDSSVLKSSETSQIIGYETDVMVNGIRIGRQTLEVEVFSGMVPFNRFASKYGHAFQGTDVQVRTVMMRFVENAKKKGKIQYVVTREGLDLVSIPHHEDERFRKPFLVWADHRGVVMEPAIADAGLELVFAGFPDPRGVYRTDIADAPALVDWIREDGNKEALQETLTNLMTCQKAELLGKLIGWHISCFWKQPFQKVYKQFPLLHVNGAAGLGKTTLTAAISGFFNYESEARPMSPGSTAFALQTHLTASSSIPMILDEYKPHEMVKFLHDKLKLMFRDAYNQRDVARGGGTREQDDFRHLQFTQLAAPMIFIAEAAEDEAAVMERVVMVTFGRQAPVTGLKNLARFQAFRRNRGHLGILGQYLAASIINEMTLEKFTSEFDALYATAQDRYMLTEADLQGDTDAETLKDKQNAKERSVYNHTVAKFGFQQFRRLVNTLLGPVLDPLMGELEDGIYTRMSDLHSATTPEHVKVLKEMSTISHHVDADRNEALRMGHEYAFITLGGKDCIEIAIRPAYTRYRMYMRSSGSQPLYGGYESFAHALKDSPAFVKYGTGETLQVPGVFVFDTDELARLGVDMFKGN